MSVKEYSLKFTQLSNYAPTMVADSRDTRNKFVMGVSDMVQKECCTTMVINDMDMSRIMVHSKQIFKDKGIEYGSEKI